MPNEWGTTLEQVTELRKQAEREPHHVEITDVHAFLRMHSRPQVQRQAVSCVLSLLSGHPSELTLLVDPLSKLLHRKDIEFQESVLDCLRMIAQHQPKAVLPALNSLFVCLDVDDAKGLNAATTRCLRELVDADTQAFLDIVPVLAVLVESTDSTVRQNTVYLIARIAEEYPTEIKPLVPLLLHGITDQDSEFKVNSLSALGRIADLYPALAKHKVQTIQALCWDPLPEVRANALGLLRDVAQEFPDEVSIALNTINYQLEDSDKRVRANAAGLVAQLAENSSLALDGVVLPLTTLLSDPTALVRQNACIALGNLEAISALGELRQLALNDSEQAVKRSAAWAVNKIESTS